jgi:hypothetical protein
MKSLGELSLGLILKYIWVSWEILYDLMEKKTYNLISSSAVVVTQHPLNQAITPAKYSQLLLFS